MSAKFTAENNIFHFNWKSRTVRFILLIWVKCLEETEIFSKSWNQSKQNGQSYCIQLEILKFKKISQSNDHIVKDLSEWRELESERYGEFRKKLVMSMSLLRKKYGFSYDSSEKIFSWSCGSWIRKLFFLAYKWTFTTNDFLWKNGWVWNNLQRSEEVFQSLKNFPLWLAKNWKNLW